MVMECILPRQAMSLVENMVPCWDVDLILLVWLYGGHEGEQNPHCPWPDVYSPLSSTLVGHQKFPVLKSNEHWLCISPATLKGKTHGVFGLIGLSLEVEHWTGFIPWGLAVNQMILFRIFWFWKQKNIDIIKKTQSLHYSSR